MVKLFFSNTNNFKTDLFDSKIGSKQVLPQWAKGPGSVGIRVGIIVQSMGQIHLPKMIVKINFVPHIIGDVDC